MQQLERVKSQYLRAEGHMVPHSSSCPLCQSAYGHTQQARLDLYSLLSPWTAFVENPRIDTVCSRTLFVYLTLLGNRWL